MLNTKKIKELEDEIERLRKADAAFLSQTPEQQLAVTLHSMLCRHNHIDGCGWEYEYNDKERATNWGGYAHSAYLEKARKITEFCNRLSITPDDVIGLLRMING